jgi:hypothetical protein
LGSIEKRLSRREKVAREIYDTEKSYVASLELMNELFLDPLLKYCYTWFIKPETINGIFGNIKAIIAIHSRFFANLDYRMNRWNTEPTIGDIFLQVVSIIQISISLYLDP